MSFYFLERAENEVLRGAVELGSRPPSLRNMGWRQRWLSPFLIQFWTIGMPSLVTVLLAFAAYFLIGGGPHIANTAVPGSPHASSPQGTLQVHQYQVPGTEARTVADSQG